MDIQKAMQAVNAAQNAADKVKPFLNLVQALDDVWNTLKDVNPSELQALLDTKNKLASEIADLTAQKAQVSTELGSLNADYQAKDQALQQTYMDKQTQLEASHQAMLADLQAKITAEQVHAKAVLDDYALQTNALMGKKDQVEQQIKAMQNAASQVLHG